MYAASGLKKGSAARQAGGVLVDSLRHQFLGAFCSVFSGFLNENRRNSMLLSWKELKSYAYKVPTSTY